MGDLYRSGALRCTRDGTNFRSALSEVRPFIGTGVFEAIRHRTIRTVNHTGTSGMKDTRYCLLILPKSKPIGAQIARDREKRKGKACAYWVDGLGNGSPGLVSGCFTVDLEERRGDRGFHSIGGDDPSGERCRSHEIERTGVGSVDDETYLVSL